MVWYGKMGLGLVVLWDSIEAGVEWCNGGMEWCDGSVEILCSSFFFFWGGEVR